MRKWLVSSIVLLMLIGVVQPALAAWPSQFADVLTWPSWALKGEPTVDSYRSWGGDLAEATWWELMIGDPPADGNPETRRLFRPYDSITRAEYAVIIGRALGLPELTYGTWYQPAVDQLTERGIIREQGDFGLSITRREMGDWVGRALDWYGVDLTGKPAMDWSDIRGLAEAPYIRLAAQAGVINGYPAGDPKPEPSYGPERTATRAEAAAMAVRLAKQLTKHKPGAETFQKLTEDEWAALSAQEKAVALGGTFDMEALRPYESEMQLYGWRGSAATRRSYDAENPNDTTYRELISTNVEPTLLRDTVALVRIQETYAVIDVETARVVYTLRETKYYYFARRGALWLLTNVKLSYPEGWEPVPEVQ